MRPSNQRASRRKTTTLASGAVMLVLALVLSLGRGLATKVPSSITSTSDSASTQVEVVEDGSYTGKGEVATYIHQFGHLPANFVSKTKAKEAGWEADKGNLDDILPGKSIGGGRFYNDDGLLPEAKGRRWTECDINYQGGHRGAERIVFSNDGLVYYTPDHYKSFERLY